MSVINLKLSVLLLVSLLLGTCTTLPDTSLPDLTFKHLKPISLKVAKIEIVSANIINADPQNVSNRFPISPFEATKKWALHRLQIAGNSGSAKFSILKANVTEIRLTTDKTLTGIFKQEASERYDATVEAQLEIFDNQGERIGVVKSSANLTQTVREDTSLTDRRRIWFRMIEKLMASFNDRMEEEIQRFLSKLISKI